MSTPEKKLLIVATRNAHKAQEIAAILPAHFEVRSLADYPHVPDAIEDGDTFAANAAIKALEASRGLEGIILADDSGLCVDALGGAPGIHSARYAGEHGNNAANNQKLMAELSAMPDKAPFSARFVCALCLAQGGQIITELEGKVEGHIEPQLKGEGGFGYDPLFIPMGYTESFGTLPAELKNKISHRANALAALGDFLS